MPTRSAFTHCAHTTTQSVLAFSYRVWRHVGFWQLYNSAGPTPRGYVLYSALVHVLLYGVFFGSTAVIIFTAHTVSGRIDSAIIAMPILLGSIKSLLVWRQRDRLAELYALGAEIDAYVRTEGHRRLVAEHARDSIRMTRALIMFFAVSTTAHGVITLLDEGRELIWPAWFPVDWRKPARGPLVYDALIGYQVFTCYVLGYMLASIDGLAPGLYKVLDAHVQVLGQQLEVMLTDAELRNCVAYHLLCVRFLRLTNAIQSANYVLQFGSSCLIICAVEFKLSLIDPDTQRAELAATAMFAVGALMQVYFPCYHGSALLWRSERLSHQLLTGEWHGSVAARAAPFRRNLLLFGEALKRPLEPSAGGDLFPITLPTMVAIVKSAYSMLAFLQQMEME